MLGRGTFLIGLLFWFSTSAGADPGDTFHCLTGPLDTQPLLICVRQQAYKNLTPPPKVYCKSNSVWKNITTPDSYNWYVDLVEQPNADGIAAGFCSKTYNHVQFATGTCHGTGAPQDCIPKEDSSPNYKDNGSTQSALFNFKQG